MAHDSYGNVKVCAATIKGGVQIEENKLQAISVLANDVWKDVQISKNSVNADIAVQQNDLGGNIQLQENQALRKAIPCPGLEY